MIEIMPGAKLPKLKMYKMTPREMEELWAFIHKNLARGFIQPAKLRMAASKVEDGCALQGEERWAP